jgi:hypothetical protein
MKEKVEKNFTKDKIGLEEAIAMDGRMSLSKVTKILPKIGDIKAQEINLIPKIFEKNGRKRIFQLKDVYDWMDRPTLGLDSK